MEPDQRQKVEQLTAQMTNDEFDRLKEHIEKQWSVNGSKCPMCGHNQWGIDSTIYEMRSLNRKQETGRFIQPLACLSCDRCSNSVLINLITANIVTLERITALYAGKKFHDTKESTGE